MRISRKVMVLIAAASLLVVSISFFARPAASRRVLPLGLDMVGSTNSAAESRRSFFTFTVSNSNDRSIFFWAALPQVQTNGDWPQTIVFPPTRRTILRADHTTQFSVTPPTNGEVWRVPVLWAFEPSKRDWIHMIWRENWSAFRDRRTLPGSRIGFGFTGQTNYTPEIAR